VFGGLLDHGVVDVGHFYLEVDGTHLLFVVLVAVCVFELQVAQKLRVFALVASKTLSLVLLVFLAQLLNFAHTVQLCQREGGHAPLLPTEEDYFAFNDVHPFDVHVTQIQTFVAVLHVGGDHVELELALLAVVVEHAEIGVFLEHLDFEVVEWDGPDFIGVVRLV